MSAVLHPIQGQSSEESSGGKLTGSRSLRLGPRDRRMLLVLLGLILALFVLLAFLTPEEDRDSNPLPSSYLTGTHGAKAAYTLLSQNGYAIERWHNPLSDLAERAGPSTVLILAEPFPPETDDQRAVREILRKGGRVLATGANGSLLLPFGRAMRSELPALAACEATPQGLSSIAVQGHIWINSGIYWKSDGAGTDPADHIDYTCGNQAVVVDYLVPSSSISAGKSTAAPQADASVDPHPGHAIWWASAMPLENGSIERGANLDLLLSSLGPPQGKHFYWDESLHSVRASAWDFVHTPVWPLLLCGAAGLLLLVVFSFSRRSGPVRALPQPPRTTPIEFLDALGALYRSTGAASTALQIAFERFRSHAALFTGQQTAQMDAGQIAQALEQRFGAAADGIAADLASTEEACWDDTIKPRRALELVRALRKHEAALRAASRHILRPSAASRPSIPTERGEA